MSTSVSVLVKSTFEGTEGKKVQYIHMNEHSLQ